MGENQLRATQDQDSKLNEQNKQRATDKERKYKLQDKQKEERKHKAHEELTEFFRNHVDI
jgi:hypothetical protein